MPGAPTKVEPGPPTVGPGTDPRPTRPTAGRDTVYAMTTPALALPRSSRRHRAANVLGTVAAATGAWAVLTQLGGVDLAAGSPPVTVGLAAVVLTAAAVALAGWALLAALERWSRTPVRTWRIVGLAVLLVSLAGPITLATGPAVGGLITLHAVVGAAVLTGLPRTC